MPDDLTTPGEVAARAIDRAYLDAAPADHRRLHAQVFTPPALAAVMADWVCAKAPRTVLDPALGTGVLARAVARRLPEAEITAFEIDPRAASAARDALTATGARAAIRVADYLTADPALTFDAVIANPPYLKRQDFPGAAAHISRVARKTGLARCQGPQPSQSSGPQSQSILPSMRSALAPSLKHPLQQFKVSSAESL